MDKKHIERNRKREAELACVFVGVMQGSINRAIVNKKDMTLNKLAKLSGLSFSQLMRILESPRKAKLSQIIRVMAALEIDVGEFNRVQA